VISFERRRQQRWTLLNVGWDPEQPPGGVNRKLFFLKKKIIMRKLLLRTS
jgi:hypothetical protein